MQFAQKGQGWRAQERKTGLIRLRAIAQIGKLARELETAERARTDLHPTAGKQTKATDLNFPPVGSSRKSNLRRPRKFTGLLTTEKTGSKEEQKIVATGGQHLDKAEQLAAAGLSTSTANRYEQLAVITGRRSV